MRNIVFSPHFDDAVLSLGGLLAREATTSTVLTFFAGAPEKSCKRLWDRLSGFHNSSEAVAMRTKENQCALQMLGVPQKQIINLAYLDKQYRPLIDPPTLIEQLVKDARAVLTEQDSVRVYAPGLQMHPDHALVRQTLLRLFGSFPEIEFFLYQDLPYAYRLRPAILEKKITKNIATQTVVLPLTETDLRRKTEAIECYASQLTSLQRVGGSAPLQSITMFAREQGNRSGTMYAETVYKLL